ncbi:MAG: hypothetical protein RL189_1817 [Pseudomonadota bacterium]
MFGVEFNGKGGILSKLVKPSKQVTDIWHSLFVKEKQTALLLVMPLAILLHALPLLIPFSWLQSSQESQPKSESVRVTITQADKKSSTAPSEKPDKPADRPTKKKEKPAETKQKVLTTTEAQSELPRDTPVVEIPENAKSAIAEPPSARGPLMEGPASPLLPSGNKDFIAKQRYLGEVIGAGAIAGDIDVPDVVSERDPKEPVTRTEYTFAGYFDNLSRRFVEAWGSVRTLPPESRFEGKIGEFIEYDVVINRDGSLRKIINISAKREPYRDFTAVDDLVGSVFKTMFPFQPIPTRIRNDPLVVRKRIQFVGFKYTLY